MYPHKECENCKGLLDCPYVEILEDGLGTPIKPKECPHGND
jgi:hypothetical protein